MKALRNKTIEIDAAEEKALLAKCIKVEKAVTEEAILDKTILGDSFEVMKNLPHGFADLIIADPPYNLSKDFGGNKFKKSSFEEYEKYTKYNELQKSCGFDLEQYQGNKAKKYTFKVLNYEDESIEVVANLLICDDVVIGGDVSSTLLNGFSEGLIPTKDTDNVEKTE